MLDVAVIGAGVAGLYQLHLLRQLGLSVRAFEAADDVGGTWWWNRYPGARFDSESYTYAYSFSEELLTEWRWSEHFAAQPETLRYLQHVADRFDLRRDITFGVRLVSAHWADGDDRWSLGFDDGTAVAARHVVLALGALSAPNIPSIPGLERFRGECFHTSQWPDREMAVDGRVAVLGTGATGVQVIQELAKTAAHLTVFQRTPTWSSPLRNRPIDDATHADLHSRRKEIFESCNDTYAGFLHDTDRRKATAVSPEERDAFYEELYAQPGFALWMGNFRDVMVDPVANQTLSEFMARKLRARVHDPAVADKLVPTDHGFGTRRVPLETNYYEVYNQPNVELIDLRETPIVEVDVDGVRTTAGHHALDLLVLATGFDAVTGPFDRIDITGVDGLALRDAWSEGPRTHLGITVAGYPNLFIPVGPHNAASFCNMPRCIEHNVEWIAALIKQMAAAGHTQVTATVEAQDAWTEECFVFADRMLFSRTDSWFTGRNRPGSTGRQVLLYAGGFPTYQESCAAEAAADYPGFTFT